MGVRVLNQSDYKWVRRAARGSKWQARPHTGPRRADNWNLGLYSSDILAHRIAVEFMRRMADQARDAGAACPAAVLVEMQRLGRVRSDVLPRWVKKLPDGTFAGVHPRVGTLTGFACPVLAYRATLAAVRRASRQYRITRLEAALVA